jgi:hypothetical protein
MGKQRRVVKELESQTADMPPPGNYGVPPKLDNKQPPHWSLGKEPKFKSFSDGQPGPLEYQIASKVDEGPKFSMGSKTFYNRNPLLTGTGPGDYNPDNAFKNSSSVYKEHLSATIAGRCKTPRDDGMPGPGSYDNTKTSKFIPGAGLGKSPRGKKSNKSELSPGPGNYRVEKFAKENNGPRFGFGTDSKFKSYSGKSPGPGSYSAKKVMSDGAPGYSMKDRRPDCRVLPGKDTPGPGGYDPSLNYTRKSGPKYGIGKSHKSKIANIYGDVPGPNQYKPYSNFVKNQAAAWGMGSNKRPALSQILDTPGPGQYNPPSSNKSGPALRGKSQVYIKDSPGPGAYSPDARTVKGKAPQFSMGTERKKTIAAKPINKFPGPGTYNGNKMKRHTSFGFGSSKRMPVKSDGSPGPGSYKIPTKVRNLEVYSLTKNQFSYV